MKHSKDKYSTNVEGSPAEEMSESHAEEMKEAPSEHELDMHHDTLMKAESIKSNPHIMKHLEPHMAKKMGHMQKLGIQAPAGKITSVDGLKAKAKSMK